VASLAGTVTDVTRAGGVEMPPTRRARIVAIDAHRIRYLGEHGMPSTTVGSREARADERSVKSTKARRVAPLTTPTGLTANATADISGALNALLADLFALYVKTKNFHWHVSGPHFRDYHVLLDEHAEQIFGTTDAVAERVRKIGGTTLRSIGHIARLSRVLDNDADYVTPLDMLAELRDDNGELATRMREVHRLCDEHGDVATASMLEVWIDETERRVWFLFEATRAGEDAGR